MLTQPKHRRLHRLTVFVAAVVLAIAVACVGLHF